MALGFGHHATKLFWKCSHHGTLSNDVPPLETNLQLSNFYNTGPWQTSTNSIRLPNKLKQRPRELETILWLSSLSSSLLSSLSSSPSPPLSSSSEVIDTCSQFFSPFFHLSQVPEGKRARVTDYLLLKLPPKNILWIWSERSVLFFLLNMFFYARNFRLKLLSYYPVQSPQTL